MADYHRISAGLRACNDGNGMGKRRAAVCSLLSMRYKREISGTEKKVYCCISGLISV